MSTGANAIGPDRPGQTDDHARTRRDALAAAAVAALAVALPALAIILSGDLRGRGAFDQINYHERAVLTFIRQWPAPDLSDYLSATTPGYHLFVAGVGVVLGESRAVLQGAGLVFSVALAGLLAWSCAARVGLLGGLALTLPVLASVYVFWPAAWLLPDNAGWLGVLAVLLLALHHRPSVRVLAGAGAVLVLLVLVRQIHLWAAVVVWTSAWLGAGACRPGALPPMDGFGVRARRTAGAVLATLPAFLVVGWFVVHWGGLTPPTFQTKYHGGNPALPAFFLTLLGLYSLFFAPWVAGRVGEIARRAPWALAGAAAAGLVIGLVPESTHSTDAGRYSGLWNLVRALPAFAERSPLIVAGSVLGSVAALAWLWGLGARDRWVFAAALGAFVVTQAASPEAWQRYNEPFVLMLLALMASRTAPSWDGAEPLASRVVPAWARRRPWAWPLALAAALGLMTAGITARSGQATLLPVDELQGGGALRGAPDAGAESPAELDAPAASADD